MPLTGSAVRRARRKDEVSPLLVSEWRSRSHGEWRCLIVEAGDMYCSAHS